MNSPNCCPSSTARPSPTPRATSSAASRSSSSPSASRICSRASSPRAPAAASTSTRSASRSGVVAGITPFNFPAMIPLWKAGPALACGNAFILKPSERDPSVPVRLAELFLRGRSARRRLPGRAGRQGGRRRDPAPTPTSRPSASSESSDIAQYIYSTAAATRQAFAVLRRRQEPHDRHARRRPRSGRRRADRRGLRQRRRALHGDQRRGAGRRGNREPACAHKLVERVNQLRVGHSLDPKADYGPLVTGAALERVQATTSARASRPAPNSSSTVASGHRRAELR